MVNNKSWKTYLTNDSFRAELMFVIIYPELRDRE